MNDGFVKRPQAAKKKIHSKNEFELCYLRHQYFRRADRNPSEAEMAPYINVVKYTTKNTFFTYRTLLHIIGMESEDLFNIGLVHLTSYLGLFSLFTPGGGFSKFAAIFEADKKRSPTEPETLNRDQKNFSHFMKQRMEDLIRVCRQKARNVKGFPAEEFHMFIGTKKPPKILRVLIENFDRYGFKRVDQGSFRTAKRRAKSDGNLFEHSGNWYVAIPVDRKFLKLSDLAGADLNPYDNLHNMSPDSLMEFKAEQDLIETYKETFNGLSDDEKVQKIQAFITKNKRNKKLKSEIETARLMLVELGAARGC